MNKRIPEIDLLMGRFELYVYFCVKFKLEKGFRFVGCMLTIVSKELFEVNHNEQ